MVIQNAYCGTIVAILTISFFDVSRFASEYVIAYAKKNVNMAFRRVNV